MRAENLQPATLEEVNSVLAALPDLTAPGFDSYYAASHERKNARRKLEGLPAEGRSPPTPITDLGVRKQISRARPFLRQKYQQRKTVRRTTGSSYGLKHEAERWSGGYISNGALIAAAYLERCLIERDGPNAYFSLSPTREYRRALRGGY
jgi:hypothetical protein